MSDSYKSEILQRLENSRLCQTLKEKCAEKDPEVLAAVDAGVAYAYQRSKTIIKYMGEYTLHDGDHLFNVLYIMELLLGESNISKLHAPEVMLLILAAFFHDIGMAPSEHEVSIWLSAWNIPAPLFNEEKDRESFEQFQRYLWTKEDDLQSIESQRMTGNFVGSDTIKGYLITEYIRRGHAQRARTIIDKDPILGENLTNRVKFRKVDLTVVFANLCFSHNENALSLLEMDKALVCGQDIYACLPLVGIILRLADIMDFDGKRAPAVLFSHLNIRHPVSLVEWQKHRSVENWDIHPDLLQFSAKCDHPAIEAAIRKYCDNIDVELSVCNNVINALNESSKFRSRGFSIKIPLKMNRDKIEASRDVYNQPTYLYRDTKFTLSKQQVVDLLMGTKLYGNPEVALRELLQNSLDACLLRLAMENKWHNSYHPEIKVRLYEENNAQVLEVEDNGTGMDQEIIDKYYTKIGASFYKSTECQSLLMDTKAEMKPTSRFGIGILSTFMVADILIVDTVRIYGPQKSSEAISLTAEGQESIFWIKPGKRETVGTSTKLILRKGKNPWDKVSNEAFIKSVESIIPNPSFPIRIEAGGQSTIRDENSFKNIRPDVLNKNLWSPSEYIGLIEFGFSRMGLAGSCVVALLENEDIPVQYFEAKGKIVEVEGEEFPLSKIYNMKDNEIEIKSTTIGTDRSGQIKPDYTYNSGLKSSSVVSLHGITIPTDLFPDGWRTRNKQLRLSWPFPISLVVDVATPMDLDLNSARSEILNTAKMTAFEEELAYCIACGIKSKVSDEYWQKLLEIIIAGGGPVMRKGFERAADNSIEAMEYPRIYDMPVPTLSLTDNHEDPF